MISPRNENDPRSQAAACDNAVGRHRAKAGLSHSYLTLLPALVFVCLACSSGSGPTGPDLDSLISAGWLAYEQGDYEAASDQFEGAVVRFPDAPEPYAGLGWSLLRLADLERARDEFLQGADKSNPPADLHAGAAFVLNALDAHAASNSHADLALTLDPAWSFSYDPTLTFHDLRIVKAENHFLLGEFALAMAEVVALNPGFSADITTSHGQGALAGEIERLRGQN